MAHLARLREQGGAAVEFALVLPVFLLLVFGATEFGFALFQLEVLTNASREGARAGIVQASPKPTAGEIDAVVTNYLTGTGIDQAQVTTTVTGEALPFPNDLTVQVSYPYTFLVLPSISGVPNSITLNASTVMRHE